MKVVKMKRRGESIDNFITRVFEQWLEWRDTIPFMEETYEKQSKVIEDLRQELTNTTQSIL